MGHFVKLDSGILDSSLWPQTEARTVFLVLLLLAEPREFASAVVTYEVGSLQPAEFVAPAAWYGFVPVAAAGVATRAGLTLEVTHAALRVLASPDMDSRTPNYEGRRIARVSGGFIVLNYARYRDRDYSAASRMRRYRERLRNERNATSLVAQVEVEAEAEKKTPRSRAAQRPEDVTEQVWTDFAALRRQRRAPVTATVLEGIRREAKAAGMSLEQALRTCVERGWQSFRADWASVTAGKQSLVRQAAHTPNMPLGHASCVCPGCVAYRTAKAGS